MIFGAVVTGLVFIYLVYLLFKPSPKPVQPAHPVGVASSASATPKKEEPKKEEPVKEAKVFAPDFSAGGGGGGGGSYSSGSAGTSSTPSSTSSGAPISQIPGSGSASTSSGSGTSSSSSSTSSGSGTSSTASTSSTPSAPTDPCMTPGYTAYSFARCKGGVGQKSDGTIVASASFGDRNHVCDFNNTTAGRYVGTLCASTILGEVFYNSDQQVSDNMNKFCRIPDTGDMFKCQPVGAGSAYSNITRLFDGYSLSGQLRDSGGSQTTFLKAGVNLEDGCAVKPGQNVGNAIDLSGARADPAMCRREDGIYAADNTAIIKKATGDWNTARLAGSSILSQFGTALESRCKPSAARLSDTTTSCLTDIDAYLTRAVEGTVCGNYKCLSGKWTSYQQQLAAADTAAAASAAGLTVQQYTTQQAATAAATATATAAETARINSAEYKISVIKQDPLYVDPAAAGRCGVTYDSSGNKIYRKCADGKCCTNDGFCECSVKCNYDYSKRPRMTFDAADSAVLCPLHAGFDTRLRCGLVRGRDEGTVIEQWCAGGTSGTCCGTDQRCSCNDPSDCTKDTRFSQYNSKPVGTPPVVCKYIDWEKTTEGAAALAAAKAAVSTATLINPDPYIIPDGPVILTDAQMGIQCTEMKIQGATGTPKLVEGGKVIKRKGEASHYYCTTDDKCSYLCRENAASDENGKKQNLWYLIANPI